MANKSFNGKQVAAMLTLVATIIGGGSFYTGKNSTPATVEVKTENDFYKWEFEQLTKINESISTLKIDFNYFESRLKNVEYKSDTALARIGNLSEKIDEFHNTLTFGQLNYTSGPVAKNEY